MKEAPQRNFEEIRASKGQYGYGNGGFARQGARLTICSG